MIREACIVVLALLGCVLVLAFAAFFRPAEGPLPCPLSESMADLIHCPTPHPTVTP